MRCFRTCGIPIALVAAIPTGCVATVVGVAASGVMVGGVVPQGINFFIPIDRPLAAFDILLQRTAQAF
jgi:hypothetical protein